ncbi:MAG: hypothetical protein ABI478_11115, partial [Propionivibrio sp.]
QRAAALAASAYLGTQFLREYQRGLMAVDGRLATLLATDLVYVTLAAAALGGVHWFGAPAWQGLAGSLLLLAGAGLASIAPYLLPYVVPRRWPTLAQLPGEMRQVLARQWHEIRWSLLGAITTDIQNRGYLFVAAAFFGPTTVAHLQVGRIFFGPLGLITNAWARVARPQLAAQLVQGDSGRFGRFERFNATLWHALWAFVAFNVLFLLGLWLAWPALSAFVFSDKYQDLGTLVIAWGVVNLVFQMRSCLSIGVQALRRFRELTLATIAGALVAALLLAAACLASEANWLIASVIGGECVAMLIVIRVLRRPGTSFAPAYAG